MATKKKATKKSASENGTKYLARMKGEERIDEINKRYPELAKTLTPLMTAFAKVTPEDARSVSGFVRSRVAEFAAERLGEYETFKKEKKLAKLEAKAEKAKKALADLAALRAELA